MENFIFYVVYRLIHSFIWLSPQDSSIKKEIEKKVEKKSNTT